MREKSSGAHSLEDLGKCVEKIKVVTLKVDTLLKILNIKKIDIVKIDVEGHESKVINGMNKLLNYNPPRALVIETKRKNSDLREYLTTERGYRAVVLDCWNTICNYGFYMVK